jgi:integrase
MRQEEICKVRWSDLESRTRMLLIGDRKDPRNKKGNNQRIPLFAATGYDAWAIVEEQRARRSNDDDRIFPSIIGQLAPPSVEDALTWSSTTFIFMICGTKARAAFSRLDSRLNRLRW